LSIRQLLGSLDLGCVRGFLAALYYGAGAGRKPIPPVSLLKAHLLKHLFRVPSDRRLALLLKKNKLVAGACGFRRKTPSQGLFTQFRRRLGRDGYEKVSSLLLEQLLKEGAVKGSRCLGRYSHQSISPKKPRQQNRQK